MKKARNVQLTAPPVEKFKKLVRNFLLACWELDQEPHFLADTRGLGRLVLGDYFLYNVSLKELSQRFGYPEADLISFLLMMIKEIESFAKPDFVEKIPLTKQAREFFRKRHILSVIDFLIIIRTKKFKRMLRDERLKNWIRMALICIDFTWSGRKSLVELVN